MTSHDHLCDWRMWKVLVGRQEPYKWHQDLHSETQLLDVVAPAFSVSPSLELSWPWPFLWPAEPWQIRDPGPQWQVFYPSDHQQTVGPEIEYAGECPGETRERKRLPAVAGQSPGLSSPAPAASQRPRLLSTLRGTALNTDLNSEHSQIHTITVKPAEPQGAPVFGCIK